MSTIHLTSRRTLAACGANQGRRYRAHVRLTTDPAVVTCVRCQALIKVRKAVLLAPVYPTAIHSDSEGK
jgi:hypothetical protein